MGLYVNILKEDNIENLIKENNSFNFLKGIDVKHNQKNRWTLNGKEAHCLQVIFIGKTGYGKSTTINKIIGHNIFETDDIKSCTKDLYSIEYKLKQSDPYYFSIGDLPGVGEAIEADKKYIKWYQDFLEKTHAVVYLVRADQRDFSIDLALFQRLFNTEDKKRNVILGLNYVDKIEPINRTTPFKLSEAQSTNINRKKIDISKLFGVKEEKIIDFSAAENYNIDKLTNIIAYNIKREI